MARKLKTIKVSELKEMANDLLASSENGSVDLCLLLESILHKTGNYKGYNNLYWLNDGYQRWVQAGRLENETKKQFYGPEFKRLYY